jgi:hypothetical protein
MQQSMTDVGAAYWLCGDPLRAENGQCRSERESRSRCLGSTKLVKHMICQDRQRPRKHAVGDFHCVEEAGLLRDPRLGSAGWNGHTDAKSLLEYKPRLKSLHECRAAMVHNWEFALRQAS